MFNTNCRIQLQHIGKSNHSPQLYLANRSPPKYFAEEILLPLCQYMNKKVTCINPNCKNSNHLNANNVDSYAICVNCQSYEHYRRAKVDSPLKSSYQDGSVKSLTSGSLKSSIYFSISIVPVHSLYFMAAGSPNTWPSWCK